MKNKPLPIFIGIFLIGIITLVWWFTNKPNDSDIADQKTAATKTNIHSASQPSLAAEQTLEKSEPVPTYMDTTPHQKEFSLKISQLMDATKKCQRDVETLFPIDSLDGPSKSYKNFPKFRDAIQKFYTVVEERVEKSHELMSFLETLPEGEISAERLFSQLSHIEDCGEFEEEAILDQAMTTALELNWPSDQKRELTNLILGLFEKQLQTNLGLHQLSSKIEVMHSLLDDGFISSHFNQELVALDQVMEGAENDFRQSLPLDYTQKKLPSQKDIIEIKNAEREAIDKVKPQILDLINLIKSRN